MSSTLRLLETKIQIPQLPSQMVKRTRLFEHLDKALHPFMRLTLIAAPAGYGKTSLVSAWVQDRKHTTAWLALDEQDDDPNRFTSYLLAALQRVNPALVLPDRPAGPFSENDFQSLTLIPLLNQFEQSPDTTLIVLDDFHWIENPAIHQVVGFMLENLPTQMHMLILTRSDPALPIARLRGRGQLNELRMEDLRFQVDEVRSFLEWFIDVRLSPDEVQILTQRTEGWIAGLQMAAVSLRGQVDQSGFISSFSGGHHYIMDYLLDEVLRRQTPRLQNFLLNTSFLPRLCESLCEAVLEGSEEEPGYSSGVLHALERANLFIVPLDQEREWYRYHHLFADLLQARLQREHPGQLQHLHRRASRWFEEQNLMEEAIQQALLCDDFLLAADLIERASQELLMRSETTTFLRWIQRLPKQEIARRPKLGIYQAWGLLFQGAPLSVVEALLPAGNEQSDPPGGAALLQAFVLLSQGKIQEGVELAEFAYKTLPQEEVFLRDFAAFSIASARIALGETEDGLRLLEKISQTSQQSGDRSAAVIFLCEMAEIRLKQMQLDEAEHLYQQALHAATDLDGRQLPIGGRALIGLGSLALERYDLDTAERLLSEGIELASRWSLISTLEAQLSLAMVYHARGATIKLKEMMETLYDLARRFDTTEIDDRVVEMVEARFKAQQGDVQGVREWISKRGLEGAPRQLPPAYSEDYLSARLYKYELTVLIRLLIAESRFLEAKEAIEQLITLAQEANRPFLILEAEILRAIQLQAQGQLDDSHAALCRALAMAWPSRAMRLFLSEGEPLTQLLRSGKLAWDSPELLEFTDQLLLKSDPESSEKVQAWQRKPETLSVRERDVLRLLPGELTAEEIARELIISVHTARSHIKSIYAKLGVHSRHQAIDKARELEVL